MTAGAQRPVVSSLLEMAFWVAVSHLMWVLGTASSRLLTGSGALVQQFLSSVYLGSLAEVNARSFILTLITSVNSHITQHIYLNTLT